MCLSGIAAATALAINTKRKVDKAAKNAERTQREAMKRAEAAQANAEAAKPGQSHSLDLSSGMNAAKKLRGVQGTYLASRQATQSTLGVA